MSTKEEVDQIQRLGIIAGGGKLPFRLVERCLELGVAPIVIGFNGQTDRELYDLCAQFPQLKTHLGAAGEIISFLKTNNVHDLVLIGSVKRPSLSELKPDLKGMKILSKIGIRALGDNQLLELLEAELSSEGFALRGIHDFCSELLAPQGVIGNIKPSSSALSDINIGIEASHALGALDIGQAVIVQQGVVIAVEGVEGTDALIQRSKSLIKKGEKAVLVKSRKPQQSKNLDLPTIGINTILNAVDAGLGGIAIQAQNVLVYDLKKVVETSDNNHIFIYGFEN